MVCFENAKVIDAEELKENLEEESMNPTLERLMFLEVRPKEGETSKIFPCFVEAWREDDHANVMADPGLVFLIDIMQSTGGEFGLIKVGIPAKELGVKKRIWDKPPTKGHREFVPWAVLEETIQ